MKLENILLLIIAAVTFVLSFYTYSRNRKSEVNISFGLLTFCGAIWAFNIAMFQMATEFKSVLFWDRMIYVFGSIFGSSFLYFSETFPFRKTILPLFRKLLIFSPFIIFLLFLFFTNLFIQDIRTTPQGNEVDLGVTYTVWMLWFFIFMGWGFINLISKYRKSTGISRIQIWYVLLALLVPAMASTPFNLIFPYFGNYRLIWIGPLCVAMMLVIIAYAITRYRLMDIRLVIGRGAIYLFSFATVIASAFFLMFLNNQLPQPLPFNAAGSLIIILSILFFQFFFRFYERFASKYFYYTFYSYQAVLTDLGKRLTQYLDLDKLSSLIVNTLINTMKLDRTVILLKDPETNDYQIQKNIGFKEENGISLVKDNFLTVFLEKTQNPLIYEELSLMVRDATERQEKEKLEKLRTNMKRIEAALCLPLLIEQKIIGLIVLGNKVSGDPYSSQDIELLTNLSNQASIALQNAKLYEQVEDLSENLQQKVDEQTKELKKAFEELKVLDKAKSEFISMASHQLRTPLSAIKGYISMLLEGSYGQLPEKAKEKLKNVFQSNERLIKIVNDLLNISKIELGRMELERQAVQLEELIQSSCEELKLEAEKRNLKLSFEKPKKPLPKINIDSLKIRQVILNLIDNAIRYTHQGEIKIEAKRKSSSILISIKDTGEGLTPEEGKRIFEGFTRGSAGINFFIEGAGLGLYVAKKFLELHDGKIWAESKGKGKGSTFYVELPIKS